MLKWKISVTFMYIKNENYQKFILDLHWNNCVLSDISIIDTGHNQLSIIPLYRYYHTLGPFDCIDINECASDPCQNGAICTDAINIYTCTCAAGYTGLQCQTSTQFVSTLIQAFIDYSQSGKTSYDPIMAENIVWVFPAGECSVTSGLDEHYSFN